MVTDIYSWANCTGGWHTLPSGNIICYVMKALPSQNRTQFCNYLGGSLLELQTMEDYSALLYYFWKLITYQGKSNLTLTGTGAATVQINNTVNILLWQDSIKLVDFSPSGMIKPIGNATPSLLPNQFLFLQPINYTSSFSPNFTLRGFISNDVSSEFICMKPGNIRFHSVTYLRGAQACEI